MLSSLTTWGKQCNLKWAFDVFWMTNEKYLTHDVGNSCQGPGWSRVKFLNHGTRSQKVPPTENTVRNLLISYWVRPIDWYSDASMSSKWVKAPHAIENLPILHWYNDGTYARPWVLNSSGQAVAWLMRSTGLEPRCCSFISKVAYVLLMRPNEGRSSCPRLGLSRLKFLIK